MDSNWLRGILATLGAAASAVLAPLALVLSGLLALMVLDLVAALIANGKRRKLDPQVGYLGWRRKTLTIIAILAIAILQTIVQEVQGIVLPAAQTVAGGFAVIELLSITRHAGEVGVKFPFIGDALAKLPGVLGIDDTRNQPAKPPPHG